MHNHVTVVTLSHGPVYCSIYSGMCEKGLLSFSWQNGSLPTVQISVSGFRFFLSSESRQPPLRAIISGAASGSCAMGLPHSEQKRRQTDLPEEPLPSHFLIGPLIVSLSLGTTTTRAVRVSADGPQSQDRKIKVQ